MKKKAGNQNTINSSHFPKLTLDSPTPMAAKKFDKLSVCVYENESDMGLASALHMASQQCRLVTTKGTASIMLMAAPSAFPFYRAYISLVKSSAALREALYKTHFFQFDDYALPLHNAASFRFLLCKHFFFHIAEFYDAKKVHLFDAAAPDSKKVCREYSSLILRHGPDLQLKGTGENGHWGFHEPGMPLNAAPGFNKVSLARENVAQQMRDHPALFPSPKDVPTEAFTANVSLFMRTRVLIEDNVPQKSKAFALLAAYGSKTVNSAVPSSALKQHGHAIVRATRASAWALLQYREKGIVSASMLDQLADSASQGAMSDRNHTSRHMRKILEEMNIKCG